MNIYKTSVFYIILFLLFFVLSCAYYNTLFNAKNEFKMGIEILQKEPEKQTNPQATRHFTQTIDKCWKLLEIYSDKSKYADDALLLIIKSEFYLDKLGQSRLHVDQFLSKYPKSDLIPEIYLWSGKLFLQEQKEPEGLENLNRSITITKDSRVRAEANYELGNHSFKKEQFGEAIAFFEKALNESISKEYAAFIQFYLGEAYFQQADYEEAIKRYRKVEKFSPSLDVEYKTKYNLARSYSHNRNDKDALNILRKMLTAPRFKNFIPYIKSEIANIYHKQGNVLDAIDLYKEVIVEGLRNPGTAYASLKLAQVYENTVHNIDSAVFYYGEVKRLYPRYDSVEVAENTHLFLSGLKKIRDAIKQDTRLVYRIENDSYFRDSLYNAQLEDSLFGHLNKKEESILDSALIDSLLADSLLRDTLSIDTLLSLPEQVRDSILAALQDTLHKRDSIRQELRADSLERIRAAGNFIERGNQTNNQDNLNRVNQKGRIKQDQEKDLEQKVLEKRKLPQIKEDLKKNTYHLAEFFLLENQNYDSALVHYENFIKTYTDSILTSKALYSIYFIHSQPAFYDSLKMDSMANLLIAEYPESPFTKDLLKQNRELPAVESEENPADNFAKQLFLEAENLYEAGIIDSALTLYQQVSVIDSNLLWSAKAQLARAWIFENDLNDINRAFKEYQLLHDNFSFNEFRQLATTKITLPDEKEVDKQKPVNTESDSLMAISTGDNGRALPSSTEIGLETGTNAVDQSSLPLIARTKRYRQWRQTRTNK